MEIPGSRIEPVHQFMTLGQLARDFFESPELQLLFMRASTTSTGCYPDDVPGLQGLIHCLPLTLSFEPAAIAVGGSQAITDALVSAGRRMGVEYETRCDVDRVVADGGRATAVQLADGTRIDADLVVSNLGLPQTLLRLLRDVGIDPKLERRIRNIHYDRGQLFWANLAISEPPRYTAEDGNPGVGSQPRLYWGPKDVDYLALRYQAEIYAEGFARRPYVLCSVDSLWDETRAPAGSHIVGVEEFAAPRRMHSREGWRDLKERFLENLLREWARYAPNMTRENVIASKRLRPRRHRARAPRHDRGRLRDRQHDRLPARPLPARARDHRLPAAAREPLRLLGEPALRVWHRAGVEPELLRGDRARPRARRDRGRRVLRRNPGPEPDGSRGRIPPL